MQSTMLLSVCLVLTLSAIGPLAADCPFEAPTDGRNQGTCTCQDDTTIVCTGAATDDCSGATDSKNLPDVTGVTSTHTKLVIKMKCLSSIQLEGLPEGLESVICDDCKKCSGLVEFNPPASYGTLTYLRIKYAFSTTFDGTPGIKQLPNLEELHWTNGDLEKMDGWPFPSTLTTINLEYNKIKTIPNIEFKDDTNNLQYLYLYGNPVTTVESDAFKQLTRLKSLRLSLDTNIPAALNSLTNLNNINDITGNFACKCNGAFAGSPRETPVEPPTGCKKNCPTATAPPGGKSVGYSIVYSNSVLLLFVCMTVCWYNYLGT